MVPVNKIKEGRQDGVEIPAARVHLECRRLYGPCVTVRSLGHDGGDIGRIVTAKRAKALDDAVFSVDHRRGTDEAEGTELGRHQPSCPRPSSVKSLCPTAILQECKEPA